MNPTSSIRAISLLAAAVGDAAGTRKLVAIVTLLGVLGIGLVVVGVWLFKITRPDPDALGPLEVMSERKWRSSDPLWQAHLVNSVRPSTLYGEVEVEGESGDPQRSDL